MTRPHYRLRHQWRITPRQTLAADCFPALYDCQFWPYGDLDHDDADPVFAAAGDQYVLLARITRAHGIQLLRCMRDHDWDYVDANNVESKTPLDCLAWLRHPLTKRPRLAVAGEAPQIKVLDLQKGTVDRVLTGHGAQIDCIRASPAHRDLLASASADHTIRVWDLDPRFEKQPCSVIFEGEGARSGIQTLAWHCSGRFIICGSYDTRISLWTLPNLPDPRSGTDKPHVYQHPHFTTTEIHTDYVDHVQFHGDLILSKAAAGDEKQILLWRIVGFDPDKDGIPSQDSVPTDTSVETRSAFLDKSSGASGAAFEILFSFDLRHAPFNWMHFNLSPEIAPSRDVLLAIGNADINAHGRSTGTWPDLSLWNLGAFSRNEMPEHNLPHRRNPKYRIPGAATKDRVRALSAKSDHGSLDSETSSVTSDVGTSEETRFKGPFFRHPPHQRIAIHDEGFMPRKTAFSSDGHWCIMVGTLGMIYAFELVES